ncbi:MAG: hypothetical protein RJA98_240 [Pseudomonadota bacterium]|jgi:hypothetical protein
MFIKTLAAVAATLALAGAAQANTIVQWNFNSTTPDANPATGTLTPVAGAGTASALGTTASYASGTANGGSSDTSTADNSGWGLTSFAAQAAGNKTRGAQFLFSTVGLQDIVFTYDLRHSNTSAANEVVQYTLDGSTFIDIATFTATAGDTWFKARSVDLSAISAADNNANFGVRVVAGFGSGGNYVASSPTGTYGAAGTWRFDQVTATGTTVPVPEPETYALMLAGLGVLGLVRRAKR